MFRIGILSDEKTTKHLIDTLEKKKIKCMFAGIKDLYEDLMLCNSNRMMISNIEDVCGEADASFFDIILIDGRLSDKNFLNGLNDETILVVNIDKIGEFDFLEGIDCRTVSYGFNDKAEITASSVKDGKIMCSLQRKIKNIKGDIIEPQEYIIEGDDTKRAMAVVSIAVAGGIDIF